MFLIDAIEDVDAGGKQGEASLFESTRRTGPVTSCDLLGRSSAYPLDANEQEYKGETKTFGLVSRYAYRRLEHKRTQYECLNERR